MKAELVKAGLKGFTGDAELWKLDRRIPFTGIGTKVRWTKYVVVSAASTFGPETFVFPANSKGKVVDWLELPGSQTGVLDTLGTMAKLQAEYTTCPVCKRTVRVDDWAKKGHKRGCKRGK